MRYDMIGIVLPFIALLVPELRIPENRRSVLIRAVLLLVPVCAGVAAIFAYNAVTFGNPLRTGYHYWCAFPYDFPSIVWSIHNIAANLAALNSPRVYLAVAAGTAGLVLLHYKRHPQYRAYLAFLALACAPAAIAHLFYAYTGTRFFVLPIALLLMAGGMGAAQMLPESVRQKPWGLAALLGLLQPTLPSLYARLQTVPVNRILVSFIRHNTPSNAVIVSGANPVYLDWYVQRGTSRTIVPVSRDVGYANLLLFPSGRPNPSVLPHIGHVRTPAMLAAGGMDPVPWTAMDQPNKLLELAKTGRPVFVEKLEVPLSYPDPVTKSMFTVRRLNKLPLIQLLPRTAY